MVNPLRLVAFRSREPFGSSQPFPMGSRRRSAETENCAPADRSTPPPPKKTSTVNAASFYSKKKPPLPGHRLSKQPTLSFQWNSRPLQSRWKSAQDFNGSLGASPSAPKGASLSGYAQAPYGALSSGNPIRCRVERHLTLTHDGGQVQERGEYLLRQL